MLTATTLLQSSSPSASIQEKATRKRRRMATVTATQVTWGGGGDGGRHGARLWAHLTLIPWSYLACSSKEESGKGSAICTLWDSLSAGARTPPAGKRGGDLHMLSWSQSWLPTLLAFAHSLVMRKPSAEASERMRFLWIVVRSEVGTLCG